MVESTMFEIVNRSLSCMYSLSQDEQVVQFAAWTCSRGEINRKSTSGRQLVWNAGHEWWIAPFPDWRCPR